MKSLRLSGNLCRLLDAVVAIATGLSLIAITMACLPERFGRGEDFVLFVLFALSRRATVQFFVLLILATAVYGTVRRGLASRMWSAFKRLVGDDETSCLIRVGLVCGSIGVSFISMELLSYAVYPMPARTQWLKPYVHLAGIPNSPYDGNTKLNALGYNGKLPERRADQFSIFLLGGSTVWYGNPSIASALETVAQENGYSNISVFNFGVAGANSAQELARLVYEVVDYHPDMIIFYDGGNDIVHPASFMDPRPCYPIEQIVQEWNPFDALRSHEPSRLVMLLSASYLLRQTIVIPHLDYFFDLEQLRRDVGWGTDQWRQRIAECYVTNHEKGRAISNLLAAT